MRSGTDVVIIGAGSVGLPLSYYLARKGVKVRVIDREASPGRGQNRAAIGGMRATHSDPAKIRICLLSLELIRNMREEHGIEVDWVQGGYLFPAYDQEKENALRNLLAVQKQFGLEIDWIGPVEVEELVPGSNRHGLRGGAYSPKDGSASPLKVANAYYRLARAAGAEFCFREEVVGFVKEGSRLTAVRTDRASYPCEVVVDASGADARETGALLGLDVPVFPDSHEAGITEPVQPLFRPMVVDTRRDAESANYYFYQNEEGQVVFCITPSPPIPGKDCDCTSVFLPLVVRRMVELYPRLRHLRVRRTWRGLYPMTPDGFPIVGFTGEYDNLLLAVGMCGQGFMLGPGLGVILAELIAERSSRHDDILQRLSLQRNFAGEEVLK
ncbi:MAG: NAD(P)/FAD-dependent oxidoreductase [Candidatus Oleimicrobiaceae bacterium]